MLRCTHCGESCGTEYCPACLPFYRWYKSGGISERLKKRLFTPRILRDLEKTEGIPEIISDAEELVRHNQGFYLYGPAGTGKTIYAAALLYRVIQFSYFNHTQVPGLRPLQGGFISVSDLLERARSCYSCKYSSISNIIKEYGEMDVLVLDELGADLSTDWVLKFLLSVIDYRYEHLKPTIITSNAGLNDLRSHLKDDRIPSRIMGMCKLKSFIEKPDYRMKGA